MHRDSEPLTALCISGGGIRSATFALGAIQGLAERGLLTRFDYLSTVSGGGYIGSWLTAWVNRSGGLGRVVPRLRRDAPKAAAGEADPIQHLREYNSYLSPAGGAFSSDLWTLIATVLRKMASLDTRLRPFHVVNLTLNLVAGTRLAWQQRKAASFTITPQHCGSSDLGYRPSSEYGGGVSLGTAVAISGAAASPNMGYHSSPVVGFIMTLFNARLGSWLGNPGSPGARTWKHPGPLSAVRSMVKEALGQTSDQSEYVYLSDGGHFENLGLYEMVRRRCRTIVVLDGGCDPDFHYDDLGNALRKIRIDLRVPIDFDEELARPLRDRRKRCAVGTIRYSQVDGPGTDGRLLYVKPMLLRNEGPDVASYAAAHPAFPHQGTGNQWFDESQTESYRSLGLHTVDEMCRGWEGGGLADFGRHLETAYLRPAGS